MSTATIARPNTVITLPAARQPLDDIILTTSSSTDIVDTTERCYTDKIEQLNKRVQIELTEMHATSTSIASDDHPIVDKSSTVNYRPRRRNTWKYGTRRPVGSSTLCQERKDKRKKRAAILQVRELVVTQLALAG